MTNTKKYVEKIERKAISNRLFLLKKAAMELSVLREVLDTART